MTEKTKVLMEELVIARAAELTAYFPLAEGYVFVLAVVKIEGNNAHLSAGGTSPNPAEFLHQFSIDSAGCSVAADPITRH